MKRKIPEISFFVTPDAHGHTTLGAKIDTRLTLLAGDAHITRVEVAAENHRVIMFRNE